MPASRSGKEASIPTSSMADIAFLLIIFFMVTAVFIHVREDRVLVDCREMRPSEILSYLEPKLTRNPGKPVILYTASTRPLTPSTSR